MEYLDTLREYKMSIIDSINSLNMTEDERIDYIVAVKYYSDIIHNSISIAQDTQDKLDAVANEIVKRMNE